MLPDWDNFINDIAETCDAHVTHVACEDKDRVLTCVIWVIRVMKIDGKSVTVCHCCAVKWSLLLVQKQKVFKEVCQGFRDELSDNL